MYLKVDCKDACESELKHMNIEDNKTAVNGFRANKEMTEFILALQQQLRQNFSSSCLGNSHWLLVGEPSLLPHFRPKLQSALYRYDFY